MIVVVFFKSEYFVAILLFSVYSFHIFAIIGHALNILIIYCVYCLFLLNQALDGFRVVVGLG